MRRLFVIVALVAGLFAMPAQAGPMDDAQDAQLDRVRREIADQVHLTAFDLIDELVWGWTQDPPFEKGTPVVLAGVTVPVGLGTGMAALVENHLNGVVGENPTTHVTLSHCPSCTAVVVHSGPEGTVVSRGVDNPKVLDELGGGASGKHALFIDIEAEGTWLVLRARITKLTPDLPIVWSRTVSTSSSTPALLRDPTNLKSASDARREYLDTLRSRGPISVPIKIGVRTYAPPPDTGDGPAGFAPPPFLWIQSGVELGATDARAWTSSLMVGFSYIPQAYQGLMAQARVNRLLGRARSVTHPDLYVFVGGSVQTVWGPATAAFANEIPDGEAILRLLAGEEPQTTFGTLQIGLDLRIGNRMGASFFLETLPAFDTSQNMGDYIDVIFGFQCMGTEVAFWF